MRAVDLFSGCGGMSQGFIDAHIDILAAYENWDPSIECYEKNIGHIVTKMDLKDIESAVMDIKKYSPDVIVGGPPCQDFSHAGKRVESNRAILTKCYANIVTQTMPQYFVMENVVRSKFSEAYAASREIYKNAGYGLTETILDASYCGVPQRRKRFICIGALGAKDGFAESIITNKKSNKPTTIRDYFDNCLNTEYYYRHPRNYNRRGIFSIDEPAQTIRGINRPIPKEYRFHPGDATKDITLVRPFTTEERAKIQTFPEKFIWDGPKTICDQMIGNAVPVQMAKFIAEVILEYDKCTMNHEFKTH